MSKVRIVKREYGKEVSYVIQQKHFLIFWLWVDAWVNSNSGAYCRDTFFTYEEAKANLYLFDGTKVTDSVVETRI